MSDPVFIPLFSLLAFAGLFQGFAFGLIACSPLNTTGQRAVLASLASLGFALAGLSLCVLEA